MKYFRILKLGLEIWIFFSSAYPGLFQNVVTVIPGWPDAQDNAKTVILVPCNHMDP